MSLTLTLTSNHADEMDAHIVVNKILPHWSTIRALDASVVLIFKLSLTEISKDVPGPM